MRGLVVEDVAEPVVVGPRREGMAVCLLLGGRSVAGRHRPVPVA
jgi:hypothetical protein